MWFLDGAGVGQITMTGAVRQFLNPLGYYQPTAIAAGPDGNLWVSSEGDQIRTDHSVGRGHCFPSILHRR